MIPTLSSTEQQQNLGTAVDFAWSNINNHSFLAVDEHKTKRSYDNLATALRIHAHPAHAAALSYLVSKVKLIYTNLTLNDKDIDKSAIDAMLLFLLQLSHRPADAADRDVEFDADGLVKRMQRFLDDGGPPRGIR